MSEDTWIQRLQTGDRSALGPLYAAYATTAIRTAFLITRHQAAAEDAVQEAFVQVLRSVGSLRDPAVFRPWFYRIVVNAAKRAARNSYRAVPTAQPLGEQVDLTTARPEEAVIGLEEVEQVRSAIAALPEAHREILVLRYYTDLSEAEITQTLGVPAGTVKSRLHRAREALAARLKRAGSQPSTDKGGSTDVG